MRTPIRFALAAITAGILGLQPVFAQQPEAELKRAQEQLEKLLKELKDKEARKTETVKPPIPPAPPAFPTPAKPAVAWAQLHNTGDANAALKGLTASRDPKVAAMAKELLEHLNKTAPQAGKAYELQLDLVKPAAGGGVFEFKVAPPANEPVKPGSAELQFKVVPLPGGSAATPGEKVERRVVVVDGQNTKPVVVEKTASASGTSTLKLSADGKTAALLATDGTISIFDVASGKEIMKFAGKK